MAFQAFIDDSYGSKSKHPHFVLAGFISTYDSWDRFSNEWLMELNESPRLEYFKMNEAVIRKRTTPWEGLSKSESQNRIDRFTGVIRNNALVRVDSSLKIRDYEKCIKGKIPKEIDSPFVVCFFQIISSVAKFQSDNRWVGPVDFVFDMEQRFSKELLPYWDFINKLLADKFGECFKNPPIFRDDKEFLPLQAADLYAWSIRRQHSENKIIHMPARKELKSLQCIPRVQGTFLNMDAFAKEYL